MSAERTKLKNPKTEGDVGLGTFTLRLANGETDRAAPDGPVLPAGTLSAYLTPLQWYADGSFCKALPAERLPDVSAWIASLDPKYAGEAAQRFAQIGEVLLWFQAVYLATKYPAVYAAPAVG